MAFEFAVTGGTSGGGGGGADANAIYRNGSQPPTADITWNSKKITSLANGTASGDAVNFSQLSTKQDSFSVLTIAKGGTNSSTALNNNRVLVSSGGAIVEASAITASKALASDSNGLPVASATTATELGYVSGVTSAIQTQLNGKQATITVLPIANGGTNSSTSLNNNRIIISSGGALVEDSAITASRALASDSNGIPVAATTTATELGYVNGVTSAIQTQLGTKAPTASPTFTGTVTFGNQSEQVATQVITTNATQTTLYTLACSNNTVYFLLANICARRTDASDQAVYQRKVAIYREAGGNTVILGSVTDGMTAESDINWDATWTVSSTNALLSVTGAAGKTIDWNATITIQTSA